jgi:hypothetical protein
LQFRFGEELKRMNQIQLAVALDLAKNDIENARLK